MTEKIKKNEPNIRVLAVLVLYREQLEKTITWTTLSTLLHKSGYFILEHCLIYDNSPDCCTSVKNLPEGVSITWAPENRGTSSAYTRAVVLAKEKDCDWILILDQDTQLPIDYLHHAARAIKIAPTAVALVPRVYHNFSLISPSVITLMGRFQSVSSLTNKCYPITAISSGALIKRNPLDSILPFPNKIWLDYVDHWMFSSFSKKNQSIGLIDNEIQHDLSVKNLKKLPYERMKNIIEAENLFYYTLYPKKYALIKIKRILKIIKFFLNGNYHLINAVTKAKKT
jgi:hypothetical protein